MLVVCSLLGGLQNKATDSTSPVFYQVGSRAGYRDSTCSLLGGILNKARDSTSPVFYQVGSGAGFSNIDSACSM